MYSFLFDSFVFKFFCDIMIWSVIIYFMQMNFATHKFIWTFI